MHNLRMPKWTKSRTLKQLYKYYKYKKDKESVNYVDKAVYTDIMKDYFLLLHDYLLDTGNPYKIPYGLGEFRVIKHKDTRHLCRNYNAEKLHHKRTGEWKVIRHRNFHTDGYKLKVRWFTQGYPALALNGYYKFTNNRKRRLEFAKYLKETGDVSRFYNLERLKRTKDTTPLI